MVTKAKPHLFIGSSSEMKPEVNLIAKHLDDVAIIDKWWESKSFKPMYSTLGSLQFAAWEHDFGLFVFSGDDETTSRGATKISPRDNVVFELGLFLGTLGPDRTFAIRIQGSRKNQRIKIPSDLEGINFPTIKRSQAKLDIASVKTAASEIRDRISQLSFCHNRLNLRLSYDFDRKTSEFRMIINGVSLQPWMELVAQRELFLVSLLEDKFINFENNTSIAVGVPKLVSAFGDDVGLRVKLSPGFSIGKGAVVLGCLILMPKNSTKRKFATIGEMFALGGQLVARVGYEV